MREQYRFIPILRNISPAYVCDIVKILYEENVRCLEVSLSESERGFGCLREIRKHFSETDDLLVGAGTVSSKAQVDELEALNVSFFVTPGFDGELVDYALGKGMKVIPGVFTPSDIQQAQNRGLSLVKLFPAGVLPKRYIMDLKGPFPCMEFLAVGGVNPDNIIDFISAGFYGVGMGSSLVPQNATSKSFDAIKQMAAKCINEVNKCI